jgi:hypothetical protein
MNDMLETTAFYQSIHADNVLHDRIVAREKNVA